jgi:hypothetical protein
MPQKVSLKYSGCWGDHVEENGVAEQGANVQTERPAGGQVGVQKLRKGDKGSRQEATGETNEKMGCRVPGRK